MSNESLHQQIKDLISKNGAMGVNALQKELGVPLSSLQKYLDKQQNYFIKNHSRKWDLPENAAESDMSTVTDNYSSIIESQIAGMNVLTETLMAQFRATLTLMQANRPRNPPVADKSSHEMLKHPTVQEMLRDLEQLPTILKRKKSDIPEEYQDLLQNIDWLGLVITKGSSYFREVISPAIANLILHDDEKLPDDIVNVLEGYQK